jgi:hypothetical protein
MPQLDDSTLATLAAICGTSKSPEFFAEVRDAVALVHFRERIRRHARAFGKIAEAAATVLQYIDALDLDARQIFEEVLGKKNDIARGLEALVQLDTAEHSTNGEYEKQSPWLFAWVKGLSELEGVTHSVAGLSSPYTRARRRPGPRHIKLGIDGKPISGGRRGGRGQSSGYRNLEVLIQHLTNIVTQSGGRLTFNDDHHAGTLVAALKLLRSHLPPECPAVPPRSTMRRMKERSITPPRRQTPQDLYDVAVHAKSEHHKAVAETLRAAGVDLARVDQYDIACAAEIHAREGAQPWEAFQIAVAHALIESCYIDREITRVLGDAGVMALKMPELDDVTLATLAAICEASESAEFFAEVRNAIELAHFRYRIRRHAQAFGKIANEVATLLQHIHVLGPDARDVLEEFLGEKNDFTQGLAEFVTPYIEEHFTDGEYEQQTPLLFAWVKALIRLEGVAHWTAGLPMPYTLAPCGSGRRYLKVGIDGRPVSSRGRRGRPRGRSGLSSGYGNLEVFVDHLTNIVTQSGGRLTFNDHHHSGNLVAALKLLRNHLPPECRTIPPKPTLRRIKERSTTHLYRLTPEDLYDGKVLAKPKHHNAIVEAVRAVGVDPAQVDEMLIACAAEIHARVGAPPNEAFPIALAYSLSENGYIDRELAKKVLRGLPASARSTTRRIKKRPSK